jgi:hypothetical protein
MQMQAVDDSGSTTTLPVNVQPRRRPAFWIDWHRRLAASIDPSFILGVRTYVRAVCSAERHGCDEVVRWCFGVCACSCGQLAPEMDWAGLGWAGLTTISIWMPLSLWRAYVRAHGARTPPFPELALAGRRRTCGATTALASLVARADRHSTMRAVTANNLLFLTVESVSATSWNRPTGLFISSTPNLGPCARYPDPVHQVPTQRTLLTRAQSRPILILAHPKPLNALRLVSPPASARIVLPPLSTSRDYLGPTGFCISAPIPLLVPELRNRHSAGWPIYLFPHSSKSLNRHSAGWPIYLFPHSSKSLNLQLGFRTR